MRGWWPWLGWGWTLRGALLVGAQGQGQPFAGQGAPPPASPGGPTPVYASAYLDRLVEVHTGRYSFDAVYYVSFSWTDPRATAEVERATREAYGGDGGGSGGAGGGEEGEGAVEEEEMDEEIEEEEQVEEASRTCRRPCEAGVARCCDTLWLPGSALRNVDELPEGRVAEEVVRVDPATGGVRWTQLLHGVFFTPMDFHGFPFESQHLLVELSAACDACGGGWFYVPSGAGAHVDRTQAGAGRFKGDDLSGYSIQRTDVLVTTWNTSALLAGGTGPDPGDPMPLTAAMEFQGLVIDTIVTRISGWYLVNFLIPLFLIVALSWTVFLVTPYHLDTRLGTCVTLFLALTTLQIVYTSDLPQCSYLTLVDALVLLSYFTVAGAAVESLAVHQVLRQDKRYAHGPRRAPAQDHDGKGDGVEGMPAQAHSQAQATAQRQGGRGGHGAEHEERVHIGFAAVNVPRRPRGAAVDSTPHRNLADIALAALEARASEEEDSEVPCTAGRGRGRGSSTSGGGGGASGSRRPSRLRGWGKFSRRWREAWSGVHLDDAQQGGAERDSQVALLVSSRIDSVCLYAFPAIYTLSWLISLLVVGLTAD